MTAQARYQDPLKPIDSTEYAAQLAQFSMVEQQVQTNEKLASLVAQLGSANMAMLSGWIGQEVRSHGAALFDGSPITLAYSPAKGADQVALVVSDGEGREVQRLPLPLSGGRSEVVRHG
ncbi:flagellar hook capping FlgD N-terminal domain-containing protein [Jhaorihella thermophila]